MGDVGEEDGEWVLSASIFLPEDQDAFNIRSHVCTESAPGGGGLSQWLTHIGDRKMGVWNPGPDYPGPTDPAPPVQVPEPRGPAGEELMRAQCHCGGVSMTFPRPTADVLSDPLLRNFVSPVDETKWVACLDHCDDCRLLTGVHLTAWTFLPLQLIDPQPEGLDLRVGTSRSYKSSAEVVRTFCSVCGATVFYGCEDEARKPSPERQVVDLSVGLLRAPEGVLAEDWLTWRTARPAWRESGLRFSKELTESLGEGMARWGKETYGRDDLDFMIG